MGRIIFLGLSWIAILLTGCYSNLIVVKNRGQRVNHAAFAHEKFKVYQSNTWYHRMNLDSIDLDALQLPWLFKKYVLFNNQQNRSVFYQAHYKTATIGNTFLCYEQTSMNIDSFTNRCAKNIRKRFKINQIKTDHFFNLKHRGDTMDLFPAFVYPSFFMQNANFNTLAFDINDKKDSFAVIECHVPIEKQKSILKVIHIIEINKSKRNLELPLFWRTTFKENVLGWVSMLDTNPLPILTHRNINNLFSYADSLLWKYGHQSTIDTLSRLNPIYTQSKDFQSKSYYYQVLMTYYSFMGKNDSSLKYQSLAFNKKPVTDTVFFNSNTQKREATDFIVQKYGDKSVILMNEAHNRGQNRHFAKQLLLPLYEKGFRYLAIEALLYEDTLIQQRGYPIYKTGIYIKEPAFGQFIREAISLGFKLVAYESRLPYNPELSMIEGQNRREIEQANNIAAVLQKDPNAKIFVYAGHGHIYKKPQGNWVRMGELLSNLLKYDIPAIECTGMMEAFEKGKENPYYQQAMKDYPSNTPFVLMENDTPFVNPTLKGFVNAQVFFPRTDYTEGYPDWLKETEHSTYNLLIDKPLQNKHLLVYRAEEWIQFKNTAIPIFQTTINTNVLKLHLKKGKYRAYVFKRGYDDILFEKEFSIYN